MRMKQVLGRVFLSSTTKVMNDNCRSRRHSACRSSSRAHVVCSASCPWFLPTQAKAACPFLHSRRRPESNVIKAAFLFTTYNLTQKLVSQGIGFDHYTRAEFNPAARRGERNTPEKKTRRATQNAIYMHRMHQVLPSLSLLQHSLQRFSAILTSKIGTPPYHSQPRFGLAHFCRFILRIFSRPLASSPFACESHGWW